MNYFNYLPSELIRKIFTKLNVDDLFNLMDVDKRLKSICDGIKINELYLSENLCRGFSDHKKIWFYSNYPDYYHFGNENKIDIYKFLNYKLKFQLDKTLIRLSITTNNIFNFSILNEFNLLEQLYVKICSLRSNFKLTLKNLKIAEIYFEYESGFKLTFDTNQLFAFKSSICCGFFDSFNEIVFNYPDKILFLETNNFNKLFSNLEYLKLIDLTTLDRNILSEFRNLKILELILFSNRFYNEFREKEFNNLKSDINFIIDEKENLKRSDFQIYFNGVKLINQNIIQQFKWSDYPNNIFEFQINNYNLLIDNCSYIEEINYCDLIKLHKTIPSFFINKFTLIDYVHANDNIDNEDQFIKFLKNLPLLRMLRLINCKLTKSFYNKLINFVYLNNCIELEIIDKIDLGLNFDFILNFKKISYFRTNQKLDNYIDLINKLFKENENIFNFEFKLNEKNYIRIQRFSSDSDFEILSFYYLNDGYDPNSRRNLKQKNLIIKNIKFENLYLQLKNIELVLNLLII